MPCLMPLWKRKGVSLLRAFTDIANHLKLKQDFQNQHVNPRNTPSISVSKATQLSWSSVTSSGNAVILPFALVLPCSSIPPCSEVILLAWNTTPQHGGGWGAGLKAHGASEWQWMYRLSSLPPTEKCCFPQGHKKIARAPLQTPPALLTHLCKGWSGGLLKIMLIGFICAVFISPSYSALSRAIHE